MMADSIGHVAECHELLLSVVAIENTKAEHDPAGSQLNYELLLKTA